MAHDDPHIPRGQPLTLDCLTCRTRRTAEWAALSDEDLAEVNATKTTRRYQRGEIVYAHGQPCNGLYCIASGTTAVRRAEPALPTVLVRLAFAGETLGYRALLEGTVCAGDAKVLEPSVICHVELVPVQRLLRRHRPLVMRFQSHLAADLDAAEAGLAQVAWLPVRSRVARLIVGLAERSTEINGEEALEVSLPMTRRDMAELLCTRPETLTRALQSMEDDGLLRNAGHRLAIPSLPRLREETVPPPA
ncbi:MAG TPA: Crp/Fnr family transcriptional regulator [bacterium]|nr:Crp/Fnr family transcriptional regulator [bacterium]